MVPYYKNISEKFIGIAKKYNSQVAYKIPKTLKIIETGKDKLEKLAQSELVCKINCSNCEASYVGRTKRQL